MRWTSDIFPRQAKLTSLGGRPSVGQCSAVTETYVRTCRRQAGSGVSSNSKQDEDALHYSLICAFLLHAWHDMLLYLLSFPINCNSRAADTSNFATVAANSLLY